MLQVVSSESGPERRISKLLVTDDCEAQQSSPIHCRAVAMILSKKDFLVHSTWQISAHLHSHGVIDSVQKNLQSCYIIFDAI